MILGQNGTGKSTIVESIYYALFRELLVPNVDCMINNDIKRVNPETGKTSYGAPSYIDLELEHEGSKYMIRSALAKTTSFLKKYNPEEGTWGEIANKVTEMYAYLQSNILNGMSSDYFINSIYTEQMGILNLVSQTPAVRQNEFDKLIGISRFHDIHEGLAKVFTVANRQLDPNIGETRKKIDEYENILLQYNNDVVRDEATVAEQRLEYKNAAAEAKKAKANLDNWENQVETAEKNVNTLKMATQSLEEYKGLAAKAKADASRIKSELAKAVVSENLQKEHDVLYSEIVRKSSSMINYVTAKQETMRKERHELECRLGAMESYNEALNNKKSCEDKLKELEPKFENGKKYLEDIRQKCKYLEDTLTALQEKLSDERRKSDEMVAKQNIILGAYKGFDIIPFDDIRNYIRNGKEIIFDKDEYECPHCRSIVSKDVFIKDLAKARKEYNECAEELGRLVKLETDSEVSKTDGQINALKLEIDALARKLMEMKYEISKCHDTIAASDKALERFGNIENMDDVNDIHAKMSDLDVKIAFKLNPVLYRYASNDITESNKYSTREILADIDKFNELDTSIIEIMKNHDMLERSLNDKEGYVNEYMAKCSELEKRIIGILAIHDGYSLEYLEKDLIRLKGERDNAAERDKVARENVVRIEAKGKELASIIQGKLRAMEPYQEFIREGREKIKANSEAERKVAMLNTAKAYFKQDGLARTIRKFYIDRINEAMKSYVSLFNFSFLPKIDDTAGIENYNMYSGGQKIAIAILMKLTLNMMLNNPINMLILDEPTPYMDSERIEAIRELVDNIKDKMQVFVITHDVEFMEISCNTINL
jgi:exonuclease SbcC